MAQEKTSQNFTGRIYALKAATGRRWEDIAADLGVTREHLYNYRAGKHSPPEHVVVRLCAAEKKAGITSTNMPGKPAGKATTSQGTQGRASSPPLCQVSALSDLEKKILDANEESRSAFAATLAAIAASEARIAAMIAEMRSQFPPA